RAPARGLTVQVRDQTDRLLRSGIPAVRLRTEDRRTLRDREVPPVAVAEPLSLALAPSCGSGEDRLEVVPRRLVRGDDAKLTLGHAVSSASGRGGSIRRIRCSRVGIR